MEATISLSDAKSFKMGDEKKAEIYLTDSKLALEQSSYVAVWPRSATKCFIILKLSILLKMFRVYATYSVLLRECVSDGGRNAEVESFTVSATGSISGL